MHPKWGGVAIHNAKAKYMLLDAENRVLSYTDVPKNA